MDNILFDVQNIEASNILDDKTSKQNLTLHLLPIQMATDVSTFNVMLVQDMRQIGNDIFTRSHIVSLSHKDIMYMPSVDYGMKELNVKCSDKNAFSHKPIFQHLQSFTPGFVADCGYALNGCEESKICKSLAHMSKNVCKIAIASLIYASMPRHKIVRVTDNTNKQMD